MLAHLPNRFNSLTRGHARATSTPPENHYNGAKLFAFARFAFAQAPVASSRATQPGPLCCYDCHCVHAQLLHALALPCLPTLLHRRSRTPSSARPFYHAQLPEASEHNDYETA